MGDERWKFQRDAAAAADKKKADKREAKRSKKDEVSLERISAGTAGARARSKRIARVGLRGLKRNQELNQKRKDAIQYRACRALLWDRERILLETGWSLQWFMSIEKYVSDEDRRIWSETDSRALFATYRDQQIQIAAELEDLSEIFRGNRQFSALVSSLRSRSDILDRVVKTGQELGVIHKTAKQVEVSGVVDVTQLDVTELRVHITKQVDEISRLLIPAAGAAEHPANAVMNRLEASFAGEDPDERPVIEVKAEKGTRRRPRRRVLAVVEGG